MIKSQVEGYKDKSESADYFCGFFLWFFNTFLDD